MVSPQTQIAENGCALGPDALWRSLLRPALACMSSCQGSGATLRGAVNQAMGTQSPELLEACHVAHSQPEQSS